MMNRTRQITIETHSITIIRISGKQHSAHCERCGKTVTAFAPKQIAAFLQIDVAEVCRRVETKKIHLINDGESAAMICGTSLEGKKHN